MAVININYASALFLDDIMNESCFKLTIGM